MSGEASKDIRSSEALTGDVRPSRLSMEGYIYNANFVLEAALNPRTQKVPPECFEKCKGVAVITVVHVGALLTMHYGTGLLLRKKEGGGWSAPSAVSVGGMTLGAVVGGKRDNTLIFIMDDENMEDFVSRPQTRMGLDAAIAAGTAGGAASVGLDAPHLGTVTYRWSEGAYAGAGVQMGTLQCSPEQNSAFYGDKASPKKIVFTDGAVKVPEDSQVKDIYEKLEMLARGEDWVPDDAALDRSRRFKEVAELQSESFRGGALPASSG